MAQAISFGGIGASFESRNFKIFWWGQLNLSLGAWVYRLAIAWLVWELSHSTAWLGIAAAAQMVPILLLCPIAGVCADRYGHLRQLIWSIAATGASGFAVALLVWWGGASIEWIVALCAINGCSRAFSISSRQALLPAMVEPKLLPSAIGVNSATYYAANFVGPLVGALLIETFDVSVALSYFGIGAVIAVVALPFLKLARHPVRAGRTSFTQDLAEGLRYTAHHKGIRLMILMVAVMALFVQPALDMLAAFADRVLAMDEHGLGRLAATFGCGAMSGGLCIAWRGRNEGLTRILLSGVTLGLLSLVVFSLSGTLWLSMPALYLCGFCVVVASTSASSLIQNTVEPALRARVLSLDSMISTGAPALGATVIGFAGSHFGVQPPMFVAAVLGLLVMALARRHVRGETRALETGRLEPARKQAAE
jgi:MFS family permease